MTDSQSRTLLLARTTPYQIWHTPGTQTRHNELLSDSADRQNESGLPGGGGGVQESTVPASGMPILIGASKWTLIVSWVTRQRNSASGSHLPRLESILQEVSGE